MAVTNNKQKVGMGGVAAAIISAVIAVEGGYVNDPRDPGGETNHGITKKVALAHGYLEPMKDMPRQVAEDIYIQDYIVKPGFMPMTELSPAVTHKLVDAGVNVGPARPSKWFQESLNDMSRGGKDFPQIQVDGKVGPGTMGAYKSLQAKRGKVKACKLIIKLLDGKQTVYYTSLHMDTYTVGWIDNRIANVPPTLCDKE